MKIPNPNLNMQMDYICSAKNIDLEYDSDSCGQDPEIAKCKQCYAFEKQDYSIILKNEEQKRFI
jgi:hypothetical protein